MRIRRKKWARPELDVSDLYIKEPILNREKWNGVFPKRQPIHLELGCGKGTFISKLACKNKDINYIAIDIKSDMLGYVNRNIEKIYSDNKEKTDNILFFSYNVEQILDVFGKKDNIERIYINFCNPWPKARHKKRRLTHTMQLNKYKEFLVTNGEIYFKTDNDELFKESLKYFIEAEYTILKITYDLHKEDIFSGNIITEHEEMFTNSGIKIKALIAKFL